MIKYDGKTRLKRGDVVLLRCVVAFDSGRDSVAMEFVSQYPLREAVGYVEYYNFQEGDLCDLGIGAPANGKVLSSFKKGDGEPLIVVEFADGDMEILCASDIQPVRNSVEDELVTLAVK